MTDPAPLRILHLEDNSRDAALVRDRLEQGGITASVELVTGRAEFEAALEAEEWDLILCDFNLPGYGGFSALQLVRDKRPLIPVIMLSGSISPEEAVSCMKGGATDYLLKQRSERLASAVSRAVREVEERKRRIEAENALRENEERLRLALAAASLEAWDVDLRRGRIRRSPRAALMFGERDIGSESEFAAWNERIHPDDRERRQAAFETTLRDGSPYEIEYRMLPPDGAVVWAAAWGTLLRDDAGRPARVIGISQDITGRKDAEARTLASLREKEVLLREIHHRVKNNLQVIASLLRIEARRITDPAVAGVFGKMKGRIHAMAVLHETLYNSQNFEEVDLHAYLAAVANGLLRLATTAGQPVSLVADIEPVAVNLDQAIPTGLVVNELVSNCLSHGAAGGAPLAVTLEVRHVKEQDEVRVEVRDSGPGLGDGFDMRAQKTLGLQLVSDLAGQLRGRVEVGPGPGACFRMVFPRTPAREWMSPPQASRG